MANLAAIEAAAVHLVGRLPEHRREPLQQALAALCETHWPELRGPAPATRLARTLWAVTPPLADLCADLHVSRDPRLDAVLQGHGPAQAFALLALEAIARGDAEGAHAAYEPMMLFESETAGMRYAEAVARRLRGNAEAPRPHPHESTPPLMRALGLMAAQLGRADLPALRAAIALLASPPDRQDEQDEALERLRRALEEIGVRFIAAEAGRIGFELHGRPHRPATPRQLGEMAAEVRRAGFP